MTHINQWFSVWGLGHLKGPQYKSEGLRGDEQKIKKKQ